jgi:hypothetical protein
MATLYESFEKIPVNRNARKKHLRSARLGSRPVPVVPEIGDAAKVISAAAAFKTGWEDSTAEPSATVRAAWAAAKVAVP